MPIIRSLPLTWPAFIPVLLFILLALPRIAMGDPAPSAFHRATDLADISGLSWIRGNLFLAVHDAKNPETLPRVSLLQIPTGEEGILWKPLAIAFPEHDSNDFEGLARIPGTDRFLLAESTEQLEKKPYSRRIFLVELQGESLALLGTTPWPIATTNIEGIAVAREGDRFLCVFAERSHGQKQTTILAAPLSLDPLRLEAPTAAGTFTSPYPTGEDARPVSALEIDAAGSIYAASAEDPDDDNGPFSSAVYRIGRVTWETPGPQVRLEEPPTRLATLDGMKVEALAVREEPGKSLQLFVGLDDENYGGTVRPIRLPGR